MPALHMLWMLAIAALQQLQTTEYQVDTPSVQAPPDLIAEVQRYDVGGARGVCLAAHQERLTQGPYVGRTYWVVDSVVPMSTRVPLLGVCPQTVHTGVMFFKRADHPPWSYWFDIAAYFKDNRPDVGFLSIIERWEMQYVPQGEHVREVLTPIGQHYLRFTPWGRCEFLQRGC